MIEPEGMGDLLAHNMQLFIRVVVRGGVEVSIVHLGRALRDVNSPGDIDARQTGLLD